MKTTIEQKLSEALKPTVLQLDDESHLHAGHAGVQERGGSHYALYMVSPLFEGQNRVARQRMVYNAISEEMANTNRQGIHALRMTLATPQEHANK